MGKLRVSLVGSHQDYINDIRKDNMVIETDMERIEGAAQSLDAENKVTPLAIRTHAGLISYFDGEDLSGKIHGPKMDVYTAFITVLNGEDKDDFYSHRENLNSLEATRSELEDTFKEVGFTGHGGRLSLPARDDYRTLPADSIGPLLPTMLALLEEVYGIDSNVAVRKYREDAVDKI